VRHELHLVRKGFVALAPVGAVSIGAGFVFAGGRGAASAAVAVALVAGNHLAAALSTAWSKTVDARTISVGYAGFVIRMAVMLGLFGTLSTLRWVNAPVLAATFCVALVVTLGAECLSYARGSYVPSWRTR